MNIKILIISIFLILISVVIGYRYGYRCGKLDSATEIYKAQAELEVEKSKALLIMLSDKNYDFMKEYLSKNIEIYKNK